MNYFSDNSPGTRFSETDWSFDTIEVLATWCPLLVGTAGSRGCVFSCTARSSADKISNEDVKIGACFR
ncbi:hypothetical protein CEXT_152631 [Caerostris extrusa]|uniref:Uncharacterized protein n=1 Tax=Caerostris extrusa TaxID=172846 RepID=A0AAV4PFG1_CAEEX|nr:hypothetical protein CEXT_152631 [Caerostris extrusa]